MEELELFRQRNEGCLMADIRQRIATDAAFRQEIEALYRSIFHRGMNKHCSDSLMDAYIQLMVTKIEKLMEIKTRRFELRPGALLTDVVNYDDKLAASAYNLTDELALYHLRTNPACIVKFDKYPKNWKELVAAEKADDKEDQPEELVAAEKADDAKPKKTKARNKK